MSEFVVMGVSGCGKTSVARMLAEKTGGSFFDADDFHPAANKAKMAAGIPLSDGDRWPWLDALNAELKSRAQSRQAVFLACSALRQIYRDRLATGLPGLRFIYLKGSKELIRRRLEERQDHFMPPALLDSQFALLEEPTDAIVVQIEEPLSEIVEQIIPRITAPALTSQPQPAAQP